jgi:hypothetical protein
VNVSGASAGYRPARIGLGARIEQLAGDESLSGAAGLFPSAADLRRPGLDATGPGGNRRQGVSRNLTVWLKAFERPGVGVARLGRFRRR